MNSPTATAAPTIRFQPIAEIAGPEPASWLWHGYLAPGKITLLTSQWKSGKTTLLTLLLNRMKEGGELAGLAVKPARVAVVSEESPEQWRDRSRKLNLDHVSMLCRPFPGRPSIADWLGLLDHLADLRVRDGLDLAVFDSLAPLLPEWSENSSFSVQMALTPLRRLQQLGLALWALHHPCKGKFAPGQAARGSGALSAFVDIIIEMSPFRAADEEDRRRILRGFCRSDDTPRQRVIELNPEGTDYLSLGSLSDLDFTESWAIVQGLLETADSKWTRADIARQWPVEIAAPGAATLWRWLNLAVEEGRLLREGSGRRDQPYRYWLPSREEAWKRDPVAWQQMEADKNLDEWFESLNLKRPRPGEPRA